MRWPSGRGGPAVTVQHHCRHRRGGHPDPADVPKQRAAPGDRRGLQDPLRPGKAAPLPGHRGSATWCDPGLRSGSAPLQTPFISDSDFPLRLSSCPVSYQLWGRSAHPARPFPCVCRCGGLTEPVWPLRLGLFPVRFPGASLPCSVFCHRPWFPLKWYFDKCVFNSLI